LALGKSVHQPALQFSRDANHLLDSIRNASVLQLTPDGCLAIMSRRLIDLFSCTKLCCSLQLAASSSRSHAAVAGRLVSLTQGKRYAADSSPQALESYK
jgi:hypothetical protein